MLKNLVSLLLKAFENHFSRLMNAQFFQTYFHIYFPKQKSDIYSDLTALSHLRLLCS